MHGNIFEITELFLLLEWANERRTKKFTTVLSTLREKRKGDVRHFRGNVNNLFLIGWRRMQYEFDKSLAKTVR